MSATQEKLKSWVLAALKAQGGSARVPEIARHIWENHEPELKVSGDLFYTWQYAMRWAGQTLQKEGKLSKNGSGRTWQLLRIWIEALLFKTTADSFPPHLRILL